MMYNRSRTNIYLTSSLLVVFAGSTIDKVHAQIITISDVEQHATSADCWSSIYGKVYDITAFAPIHPGNGGGGDTVILLCGIDGTSLYDSFHGNNPQYLDSLSGIEFKGLLGTYSPTKSPTNPPTKSPTPEPTLSPTPSPTTKNPTISPTTRPSLAPTEAPTLFPSYSPTANPSDRPSMAPSGMPSMAPSMVPSRMPSMPPSMAPSKMLSMVPTDQPTEAVTNTPTTSTSPSSSPTTTTYITMTEVASHNTHEDCWSAVYGIVYDLTVYAPSHPQSGGGSDSVYQMCGIDGTSLFDTFHGSTPFFLNLNGIQRKGVVMAESESPTMTPTHIPTSSPTPANHTLPPSLIPTLQATNTTIPGITLVQLALHKTTDDCWVAYYDEVYDVTEYALTHPGGPALVTQNCGENGTQSFAFFHKYEQLQLIQEFFLGKIVASSEAATATKTAHPTTMPPTSKPTTMAPKVLCDDDDDNSEESEEDEDERGDRRSGQNCQQQQNHQQQQQSEQPTGRQISMQELSQHNGEDDCWVSYYNEVYDVTEYALKHPGGAFLVTQNCGEDGTKDYENIHPYSLLQSISPHFEGILVEDTAYQPVSSGTGTNTPTAQLGASASVVSRSELAQHKSPNDCWVSYYGEVFDVTDYASKHPGGASLVTSNCGHDDTESYSAFHDYEKLDLIRKYFKGKLSVEATAASKPGQTETADSAGVDNGMIRFSSLQQHNTPEDCWISYYDKVYDMTRYAPLHPAGAEQITADCGKDGSKNFETFHGPSLLSLVKQDYLGLFDTTTFTAVETDTQQEPVVLTMDEVALHNNPGSCWVRYYNDIYDLTYYSHPSPPGESVIYLGCGRDSTVDFATAHPRHLLKKVEEHRIGWVETSSAMRAKIGVTTAFVAIAPILFLLV